MNGEEAGGRSGEDAHESGAQRGKCQVGRLGLVAGLICLLSWPPIGLAHSTSEEERVAISAPARYRSGVEATRTGHLFVPQRELFRPLLADVKEPKFSASLRYETIHSGVLTRQTSGESFWGAAVSFGDRFSFYGYRPTPHTGIQVGLFGGVFSTFNLDTRSENLVDSDFRVGIPATGRIGAWSIRLQIYHQSSHLRDEFLLENEMVDREEFSFEAVEGLLSYEGSWWRVYGGGGGMIHRVTEMAPIYAQLGAEVRISPWSMESTQHVSWLPVLGVDVQSFQERHWGLTASAKGGLELAVGPGAARRVRLMAVFLRGYVPFGQFFDGSHTTNGGLELQFEL